MITLEKIDQVVERTGVSYEKAKEVLERCKGDVIEAIIFLEKDLQDKASNGKETKTSDILETLKDFVRKGNVSRIIVSDQDNTLLNIPVTIGAIGIILAPVVALLGAGAAVFTKLQVSILDSNGNVIDINKETAERLNFLRKKGEEMKETAEKAADDIKEKFSKKSPSDIIDIEDDDKQENNE